MIVVRPHPVLRMIISPPHQLRPIKAGLMAGNIPIAGKGIDTGIGNNPRFHTAIIDIPIIDFPG